jgi:hypothetical protein
MITLSWSSRNQNDSEQRKSIFDSSAKGASPPLTLSALNTTNSPKVAPFSIFMLSKTSIVNARKCSMSSTTVGFRIRGDHPE